MNNSSDPQRERFAQVFRDNYGAVERYLRRRADPGLAEEVIAEVFAIAWTDIDRLPASASLPWLYRVAANVLADHRRAAARTANKTARAAASEARRTVRDPADELSERDAVLRAFAQLSDRLLDRLAAADPAGHLPESEPDMALFEHLVAAPATAPARWARVRRAPRTLAFAFGALVATAASVALVVVSVGGGSVDLAAKAYAQSTPSGAIVHYVETARYTPSRGNPKMLGSGQSRLERWVYGDRSHTILKSGGETYDQELGSDQVLHNHIEPGGEDQTLRPGDTEYAHIIAASKQDPVSQYRARYDAGELTDAGETTLEGRTARGYTYTKTARFSYGPETTTDTFYVDPASGELLGSREEVTNASGTSELVRTLTEFERLPVTPENLAKLSR